MIPKEDCIKAVKKFRAKQGVEAPDENIIATSESKGLTVDVRKKAWNHFSKPLKQNWQLIHKMGRFRLE